MLGNQIQNRLSQVLSNFTNDFSDVVNITSLTKNNTLITANAPNHGLLNNEYITIKGAKRRVNIQSITYAGGVATLRLAEHHNLYIETNPSFTIIDCTIAGYNGTKNVNQYPDFYTIEFTSQDYGNATDGYILLDDNIYFNGYKQITVINGNSFSYPVSNNIANNPAYGTITCNKASRIQHIGSSERAVDVFKNDTSKKWMFIILGDERVEENGATPNTDSYSTNQTYYFKTLLEFSIFVALPTQDSKYASAEADLARSYLKPILKSIANYRFISNLTQDKYQPCLYIRNDTDAYDVASYVHRFDFAITGEIIDNDGVDHFADTTPLLRIDLNTNGFDSNINY